MNAPGRWRRAWHARGLLADAALALLAADCSMRWRGSEGVAARLGRPGVPAAEPDPAQLELAREVAWAVAALVGRWPWRIVCLPQALAAQALLNRRGVPCVLHLGLGRDDRGRLRAHAWLRSGSVCVTGADMAGQHAEIAAFR